MRSTLRGTHSVQAMVWPVVSLPARKKMKYSCAIQQQHSVMEPHPPTPHIRVLWISLV